MACAASYACVKIELHVKSSGRIALPLVTYASLTDEGRKIVALYIGDFYGGFCGVFADFVPILSHHQFRQFAIGPSLEIHLALVLRFHIRPCHTSPQTLQLRFVLLLEQPL